ncbi:hypothetical protein [Arsenicibacter rosenii]|uniref:Lipoprotein n=1 Tax=Arsenicibacter rosenii TaxID=1750698 RepID=A0A1S2VHI0_9BACT|nr:hypothetical protein [Arsenicibacter rosenii]OIN57666.1 hypothetical protein BLX24_18110 [Arsenicibacter rosenii]
MRHVLQVAICLGMAVFSACTPASDQNQTKVYYDLEGFVKKQIALLEKQKPMVDKAATIKQQTQNQQTREVDWAHELELFVQADLNKSAFRSSYQVSQADPLSYTYTLKPEEDKLTVRSLSIQLDSATRQPRRIEALLRTRNLLYESDRHVLMTCAPASGSEWRVQHYAIDGYQQLRFFERNDFGVKATVH